MSRSAFGSTIRVLLADDHSLFRAGISLVLRQHADLLIVGEAADGSAAIALAGTLHPDVVLLDFCMPGMTADVTLKHLRQCCPDCAVLMLTGSEDADDLALALAAGARGYLIKNIDGAYLANAIRRAAGGDVVLSDVMTRKLVERVQQGGAPSAATIASLTPRERQILAALAEGGSNKTIARALGLAESTVKIHVQHVLKKLHMNSRVQAALFAIRQRPAAGDAGESH